MALVIENGQVVDGADSYVTAAELVTYAANYGLTIPATEGEQEALLRRAYLQMNTLPWKGWPVNRDQTGAWPRYGVLSNGYELPSDVIPRQVKQCQMAMAGEIHADDIDPPELRKGAVIKDRVEGAVERQYAAAKASRSTPVAGRQSLASVAGLLESSWQIPMVRG